MLVAALVLVASMMSQLRRPETAARIEQVFTGTNGSALLPAEDSTAAAGTPLPLPDAERRASQDRRKAAESRYQLRKLLALAGWDAERLAKFADDQPLTDDEREELLGLLRRLKTFDAAELAEWARADSALADVAAAPDQHRGELVRLSGHVQAVRRTTLPPDMAARLELPAYIECQLALDEGAGLATIITARVPRAWTELDRLDEPAVASGLFVKLLPAVGDQVAALFVSADIAWHPREVRDPDVSFGKSLLGSLGMDVGRLDTIEQRRTILATEREAFYQLLDAAGRAGANQLIRFANGNLPSIRNRWAGEAARLAAVARQSSAAANDADRKQRLLASEVEQRTAAGRYSVAPLFNAPDSQVGELVVLDGVARRVVRIDVGMSPDGTPSDVRRRFGIDHYFELDLFTDDSQNNPIVFCVRELPAGFPTGESIREPVRLAGFFFKSWSFRSRRVVQGDAAGAGEATTRQFAPLLVGRGPIWLQPPSTSDAGHAGLIFGGLFVLLLATIWAAVWWNGRAERRFHDRTFAARFSLPADQSLDDIALELDNQSADSLPGASGTTTSEV